MPSQRRKGLAVIYRHKGHLPPLCRYCGGQIAKYTTRTWVREKEPPSRGGSAYLIITEKLRSKADCQKHSNLPVVSVSYSYDTDANFERTGPRHVTDFTTWDGESYVDEFFCKGPCAHGYARMMAVAGDNGRHKLESVAYRDAINRRGKS